MRGKWWWPCDPLSEGPDDSGTTGGSGSGSQGGGDSPWLVECIGDPWSGTGSGAGEAAWPSMVVAAAAAS